jgi:hypothetical protein
LRLSKDTGVYNLHVGGAAAAAMVVREIEPFMRTENKAAQISGFKESVCRPRKHLSPSIRTTMEILGLVNRSP